MSEIGAVVDIVGVFRWASVITRLFVILSISNIEGRTLS